MKILVIGGTRFIGAALVRELHRMGHEIAVFNRGQSPAAPPEGVQRITGDLTDLDASAAALRAFAPEIVVHNMVLQAPDVTAFQALFAGKAKRFVMTSSMDVYQMYGRVIGTEPGDPLPIPADEDAPLREKRYPYRETMPDNERMKYYDKIPAEEAALRYPEFPGVVLRLPMVIGPHDYQRRLLSFVKPMQDGREAIVLDEGYAHWRSTYGYIDNVARAMALATVDERALGRVYNVGDGGYATLALGRLVADAMQWQGEFVMIPSDELPESLRAGLNPAQDLVCSAERIQRELDYAPVMDFAAGIAQTVQWEIDNPPAEYPPHLQDYSEQDAVLAEKQT